MPTAHGIVVLTKTFVTHVAGPLTLYLSTTDFITTAVLGNGVIVEYTGGKYRQRYRCATHIAKVFVEVSCMSPTQHRTQL